jgi:hypothetical protein
MKKALGLLLAATIFATPFSRVTLVVSLCLGWLLWNEASKTLSAQQKLKLIRIPAWARKSKTLRHN